MDALTIIVFLVKSIMSGVVCINNISTDSLRWNCKGIKVIYLHKMTSIVKSIKDAIKFISLSIITFVTQKLIWEKEQSIFYSFHRCKSDDVSLIYKETDDLKNISTYGGNNMHKWNYYTRLVSTGTKGSAPNIIDFPTYRVILCSLSEQYYGAHRATNGEAATGIHLQRSANLLDKLIKLAINLGRPCAAVVYETVEESFIMRTIQLPLEKILSPFLRIYTSKDTQSFPSMH